ncbi:MAG: hypothetical protein V1918_09000 [Planctomycetota bacterium]
MSEPPRSLQDWAGDLGPGDALLHAGGPVPGRLAASAPAGMRVFYIREGEIRSAAVPWADDTEPSDRSVTAWSEEADLLNALLEELRSAGVRRLFLPPQRTAEDARILEKALKQAGVEPIRLAEAGVPASEDYLPEEEAGEVAERLRELGYL